MQRSNEPRIYGPYKHGDVWRLHYVRRRADGTRTTEYTTHATRAAADLELAGARDETQGITVMMAVDMWLEKQRARSRADSTIENYEHRLWMTLGLPGNALRPIRWVAARGTELYQASLVRTVNGVAKKRADDTQLNGLSVAKRWGAWCVKEKLIKANPFADVEGVGRKAIGADKSRLTVDESRTLRDYCHANANQDTTLTLAYLLLGPRASELVKRVVRDVDDDGQLLWIGKTKTAAGRRRLILPDELRPLFLELTKDRSPDAPLFVYKGDTQMTRFVARGRVMGVCKAAGVPVLPPQALRRTQATLATDAGATGPMVSAHLGHVTAGDLSQITKRSYVEPNAQRDAHVGRSFRVLNGGRR